MARPRKQVTNELTYINKMPNNLILFFERIAPGGTLTLKEEALENPSNALEVKSLKRALELGMIEEFDQSSLETETEDHGSD